LFLIVACSGGDPATESSSDEKVEAGNAEAEISEDDEITEDETAEDETAEVNFEDLEEFDRGNFDQPAVIDNQWLPLIAGTQWIFEGTTDEDGEQIPHRIEFTVTDLTKEIDDVSTVVAFIEDYADDELVEAELAFYAQDNDGNVWYLGEYPEEYEDGEFIEAPAWIAGLEGAKPGIKMMAEPRLGTDSYSQGWGPEVEWTDRGQVYKLGQQTCVAFDCYSDVLVVDEFNQEEPNAFQQKYYARGVGNVQVGWRGEDAQQEELELVEMTLLDPGDMGEVRKAALALEARAYEISPDVYGQTPPSEAPAGAVEASERAEKLYEELDRDNFEDSTNIDNKWLPMQPGTQWTFEGYTIEDGDLIPHLLVFTVTDLIKEIDGVHTAVAWIEDYSNEELVEAEIAFYAQDDDGNVWYFGEYPEEYERGQFVDAPAWIAGLENARAGIKMPAEPQLGMPSVSQGLAPMVQWTDRGEIYRMDQHTCVPFDCYDDVLIMDEFNAEEPGAIQLKFYAPDVGQVRVGFRGSDIVPEILELVDRVELDQEAMADARESALKLEARAYEISPNVYGQTEPMQ
jgi:hypothetical protein